MVAVALIGGALFVLQQFAGINGVLYFSSLTFQDVGITSSALASLLIGVTNFAGMKYNVYVCLLSEICFLNKPSFASLLVITGALGALYLIDKQGRQKLLIGSYLGMVSCTWIILRDDDKLTMRVCNFHSNSITN